MHKERLDFFFCTNLASLPKIRYLFEWRAINADKNARKLIS